MALLATAYAGRIVSAILIRPDWGVPSPQSATCKLQSAVFFSFDGVDGVGKTTQARLFCDWLREQHIAVLSCRDPGSTKLGEAIRAVLLERSETPIHRRSEMLLYMAARSQLVEELVRPALAAGKTVVCDRFLLANVVYQGHAGGLDVESLWSIGQVATGDVVPDLTFVLDMDADAATDRLGREPDRMESQGREFLQKVRQGYQREAARSPERIVLIRADQEVGVVQAEIRVRAARFAGYALSPSPSTPAGS